MKNFVQNDLKDTVKLKELIGYRKFNAFSQLYSLILFYY